MMKKSSLSMVFFALYLAGLSLAFMAHPNAVITRFGFAATDEIWIRIVGYLAGILAFFYLMAVRQGVEAFYRWTIYARLPIFPLYLLFVAAGLAPAALLLFGAIDLAGALWTWWLLQREEHCRQY